MGKRLMMRLWDWVHKVAQLEAEHTRLLAVARAASNIECPNYPDYDWANGSEEYQVRRQQLREALAAVEDLL